MDILTASDEEILSELSAIQAVAERMRSLFCKAPDDPKYCNRSVLVASAQKLSQQVRAIRALYLADCLEEAVSVARTLVEVVINAIYLQEAESQELSSFLNFDTQKIIERLERDAKDGGNLSALTLTNQRKELESAIGRTGRELSWSKRTLQKRALFVDDHHSLKACVLLHDVSSRTSNFATHGTFLSLIHHFSEVANVPDDTHRQKMFHSAMLIVYSALQLFGRFSYSYALSDGSQP